MKFQETTLPGVFLIEPEKREDERGFFARTYCAEEFRQHGIIFPTAQCNISSNRHQHTLRGMHYAVAPHAESKLVRCTKGRIFDVALDLRKESATYLQWFGAELAADTHNALYIPEGCAHGFLSLEADTEVFYQMGSAYVDGAARGVRWDDKAFGIAWPAVPRTMSERDATWPDYHA